MNKKQAQLLVNFGVLGYVVLLITLFINGIVNNNLPSLIGSGILILNGIILAYINLGDNKSKRKDINKKIVF